MRPTCWIVLHAANTVVAAIMWIAVLSIVFTQLHKERQEKTRNSSLSIEQALTASLAAATFMLFSISHGYASVRALASQIRNPLLLRSSVSQIICLVYNALTLLVIYFVLIDSEEYSPVGEAYYALQWLVVLASGSSTVFVLEQFSHPQLIYCCDNEVSRSKLRARAGDSSNAQQETPLAQTSARGKKVLVAEISDCSEEDFCSLDMPVRANE